MAAQLSIFATREVSTYVGTSQSAKVGVCVFHMLAAPTNANFDILFSPNRRRGRVEWDISKISII
jgi:hypothetical protein